MTAPLYRTIVVPTDLSEPSRQAVRHAAELVERVGGRIVLVHVVEDRLPAMILAHTNQSEQEILDRHREAARRSIATVARELLPRSPVECVVRQGASHQQIVALAREIGADLIVMGMHGHGFLTHALAGSTTERVLHHAPCPVLVVGWRRGDG
jgi:nucleotide-binding universal stress UspA family protein